MILQSEEEKNILSEQQLNLEKGESKKMNIQSQILGDDLIELNDQNECNEENMNKNNDKEINNLIEYQEKNVSNKNINVDEREGKVENELLEKEKEKEQFSEQPNIKATKEEKSKISSKPDIKKKQGKSKQDKGKVTKIHKKYETQLREPTIYEKALDEMIKEGKLMTKNKTKSEHNLNEIENEAKGNDQISEPQSEKICSKDMKAKLDLLLQLKTNVYNMQLSDAVDRSKIQKLERENKDISDKIRNIEQQIAKIEKSIVNDNPYIALQEEQLAKLNFSKNEKSMNESSVKLNDKLSKLTKTKEEYETILNNLSNISSNKILDKLNEEYKKAISNIKTYFN